MALTLSIWLPKGPKWPIRPKDQKERKNRKTWRLRSNSTWLILKIEVLLIPKLLIALIVLFDVPSLHTGNRQSFGKLMIFPRMPKNTSKRNRGLSEKSIAQSIAKCYNRNHMSFPAKWLQSHIWPFERTSLSPERPKASAQDTGAHFCPGNAQDMIQQYPTATSDWHIVNALRCSFWPSQHKQQAAGHLASS